MAYARDPNLAFEAQRSKGASTGWGPPLHTGHKQPVTYTQIRLLNSNTLEGYGKGQLIAELHVDWVRGIARVFEDSDDALNGVCRYEGVWRMPEVEPEPLLETYLREAVSFVERGHSLLNPACTCVPWMSEERCRKLGILPKRNGWCSLSQAPREVSATELSNELAVEDVCVMPGASFMYALEKRCTIRVEATEKTLFFSPRGVFLGPVRSAPSYQKNWLCFLSQSTYMACRSKEDLLKKLRTHALPFEQAETYAGMGDDIRELEEEGVVFVIERPQQQHEAPYCYYVLHHLRPDAGRPVDDDIKALWELAADSKRARISASPIAVAESKRRG